MADVKLSVVVPVYNEAGGVRAVIDELLAELRAGGHTFEVIVVDDGSTDGSGEVIDGIDGITVLRHRRNRGYGAALKTGIHAAHGSVVVTFDADGQHRPTDIWPLLNALDGADAAIGARQGYRGSPLWRAPGKWVLARLASYLSRQRMPDFNSGLRAVRRSLLLKILPLCADRFSFSATSTLALFGENAEVCFVPIEVRLREGQSTVSAGTGFEALIVILRVAMLFSPLRIFLPAAFLCGLTGVILLVHGILIENIYDACVLLLLSSALLLFFGLVADQVAQLRKNLRQG